MRLATTRVVWWWFIFADARNSYSSAIQIKSHTEWYIIKPEKALEFTDDFRLSEILEQFRSLSTFCCGTGREREEQVEEEGVLKRMQSCRKILIQTQQARRTNRLKLNPRFNADNSSFSTLLHSNTVCYHHNSDKRNFRKIKFWHVLQHIVRKWSVSFCTFSGSQFICATESWLKLCCLSPFSGHYRGCVQVAGLHESDFLDDRRYTRIL